MDTGSIHSSPFVLKTNHMFSFKKKKHMYQEYRSTGLKQVDGPLRPPARAAAGSIPLIPARLPERTPTVLELEAVAGASPHLSRSLPGDRRAPPSHGSAAGMDWLLGQGRPLL